MKKTIICIDRDGTLIYDSKDHLFLGKDDAWESEIKLLPHVIDGLKALIYLKRQNGSLVGKEAGKSGEKETRQIKIKKAKFQTRKQAAQF